MSAQVNHSWVDVFLNVKESLEIPSDDTIGPRTEKPFVRISLPAKETATGRAVVICLGGGYSMVLSKKL